MQLSRRLQMLAALVTEGNRLADVGTDHAYVPIWLWERGRIPGAIAMDIGKGPLKRAEEHIREHGGSDAIETRLGNGLEKLAPGECDTVLIAGMGGQLMRRILADGMDRLSGVKELVLQPQSDIWVVRRFLQDNGFRITREEMLCEEGKYYPMMRAVPGEMNWDREVQFVYGGLLLEQAHPVLYQFLLKEEKTKQGIARRLRETGTESGKKRLSQIEGELELLSEAMAYYKNEYPEASRRE